MSTSWLHHRCGLSSASWMIRGLIPSSSSLRVKVSLDKILKPELPRRIYLSVHVNVSVGTDKSTCVCEWVGKHHIRPHIMCIISYFYFKDHKIALLNYIWLTFLHAQFHHLFIIMHFSSSSSSASSTTALSTLTSTSSTSSSPQASSDDLKSEL